MSRGQDGAAHTLDAPFCPLNAPSCGLDVPSCIFDVPSSFWNGASRPRNAPPCRSHGPAQLIEMPDISRRAPCGGETPGRGRSHPR
jgi:hypothetical protein